MGKILQMKIDYTIQYPVKHGSYVPSPHSKLHSYVAVLCTSGETYRTTPGTPHSSGCACIITCGGNCINSCSISAMGSFPYETAGELMSGGMNQCAVLCIPNPSPQSARSQQVTMREAVAHTNNRRRPDRIIRSVRDEHGMVSASIGRGRIKSLLSRKVATL